ncbi:MAG: shikimate kinase [Evtepia sp.]
MKTNIILIGMPGCGKSTLGFLAAKQMGLQFLDTDKLLESRTGKTLSELLSEYGLTRFLALEEETLLSLKQTHTIIATGGSAVYAAQGMQHLKTIGHCVYLSVPYSLISTRLSNLQTRGVAIAEGKSLRALYEERSPLYEQYADLIFHESENRDPPSNARLLTSLLYDNLDVFNFKL